MTNEQKSVADVLREVKFLLEDAKRCADQEKWHKVKFRIGVALGELEKHQPLTTIEVDDVERLKVDK